VLIGQTLAAHVAQANQAFVVPVTVVRETGNELPRRLDLTLYGTSIPTKGGQWLFYLADPGQPASSEAMMLGLLAAEEGAHDREPVVFTLYPRHDVMAAFLKLKRPAIRIVGDRGQGPLRPTRITAVLR
jgi:hypothetical protein